MNSADAMKFGGIATMVLTYTTDLERIIAEMQAMYKTLQDKQLKANTAFDDMLRKGFVNYAESNRHQREVNATLERLNKLAAEARAAVPDFERHVLGQHAPPARTTFIADKTLDSFGSDLAAATAAGAIVEMGPPTQAPTPDPTKNIGDTYLRRFGDNSSK